VPSVAGGDRRSVSTLGLRTRAMPRWHVLLGYAVALASLVAPDGHFAISFLFRAWVLLVSVLLLLTRPVAAHRFDSEGPS